MYEGGSCSGIGVASGAGDVVEAEAELGAGVCGGGGTARC
jgi:hypothetical protein